MELDQQLSPVGDKGERLVLIEPEADSPIGNRYRECEFYRDGDTIYLFASGGDDPRRIVNATNKVADNSATEKNRTASRRQAADRREAAEKEKRKRDRRTKADRLITLQMKRRNLSEPPRIHSTRYSTAWSWK